MFFSVIRSLGIGARNFAFTSVFRLRTIYKLQCFAPNSIQYFATCPADTWM